MTGHVLRNALIPLVTVVGIDVPLYLTGAVLTETVFSWPGMGRLFFDALTVRDYPVLMGILILGAVLIVVGNLIADLVYGLLDPGLATSDASRSRREGERHERRTSRSRSTSPASLAPAPVAAGAASAGDAWRPI